MSEPISGSRPRPGQRAWRATQGGSTVAMVLIALVAMIVSAFVLIRTVNQASQAAVAQEFVRGAGQNLEMAIDDARLALRGAHPEAALNIARSDVSQPDRAYAAAPGEDGLSGLPARLTALAAPSDLIATARGSGWPGERFDAGTRQWRRYLIERLCPGEGTDGCEAHAGANWYRITARADGPEGRVRYAQAFARR